MITAEGSAILKMEQNRLLHILSLYEGSESKEVNRMKKAKIFFDIEKEEQWLNEQLQKGYRCTNISGLGIYTFEKTGKRYVMRLDYQDCKFF